VLERKPLAWKLDRKESTKLSLKYRRSKGEILIVSHGGKGWWIRPRQSWPEPAVELRLSMCGYPLGCKRFFDSSDV
jgi:hypothetical protein